MAILKQVQDLLDTCEVNGKEPHGFLCSPGVYAELVNAMTLAGIPIDHGLAVVKPSAPDLFVHGLPLWCIPGYPPGKIDAVGREAVDDALRFVGRLND